MNAASRKTTAARKAFVPAMKQGTFCIQQLRKHQALVACLVGLALTRVWLQGMLFGFYAHSDAGFSTTINQWSYGSAILIGALIAWKRPRSTLQASVMAWAAFFLGTIAGIIVFLTAQTPSLYVHGAAMVLCGVAGALLGGMWVLPFLQLHLRSALIGTFCALGLGSALAWMIAFANDATVMTLCLLIPSINLLLFRRAERVEGAKSAGDAQNEQLPPYAADYAADYAAERCDSSLAGDTGAECEQGAQVASTKSSANATCAQQELGSVRAEQECTSTYAQRGSSFLTVRKPVYDYEPLTSLFFIYGGVIVLSLALGIARGYPFGTPLPMDVLARCVHQGGVVLLSTCIVIKLLIGPRSLSFLWLWRCEVLVLLLGAASIVVFNNNHVDISIAIINCADTFMLGVLWAISQDVARYSSFHPFAIFGFIWTARVLARNVARVLIFFIGAEGVHYNLALGAIVVSLGIGMAFLLTDKLPRKRALFTYELASEHTIAANDTPAESATAAQPTVHEKVLEEARSEARGDVSGAVRGDVHGEVHEEHKRATAQESATEQVNALNQANTLKQETVPQRTPEAQPETQQQSEHNRAAAQPARTNPIKTYLEQRYQLTERECEIILYLAQGYSKSSIGERLFVSENTVRTHVRKAYTKLGIHSKTQLAQLLERIKEQTSKPLP